MGYIAKNWRGVKDSILSQKFLDRVRPEATLKNKIDGAGKKMEFLHNQSGIQPFHVIMQELESQLLPG